MKMDQGSRLCAASFLACFDNRPGYWTRETLGAAVQEVFGPMAMNHDDPVDVGSLVMRWADRPEHGLPAAQRLLDQAGARLVVLCMPVHTGTEGFQQHVAPIMDQVVFLRGRVRNHGQTTTPPYDSMLVFVHAGTGKPDYGDLDAMRSYTAPAMAYVMDHGARSTAVVVRSDGLVQFHADPLPQLIENGADWTVTLKPAPPVE